MEQITPLGSAHPSAKAILSYHEKLGTSAKSVGKYPTTADQRKRFIERGWQEVNVQDLWEFWSSKVTEHERASIDGVEPFDEWEEYMLFCRHWFVLYAKAQASVRKAEKSRKLSVQSHARVKMNLTSSSGSKNAAKRFGNLLHSVNSRGVAFAIHMMGLGTTGRSDTYEVFGPEGSNKLPHTPLAGPAARMCATLTDLGDFGWLMVGGRNSPSNAMSDCWILNKAFQSEWKQIQSLPLELYRHAALRLGETGLVLVGGGRVSSTEICDSYFVLDIATGWQTCRIIGSTKPFLFGHNLCYGGNSGVDLYNGRMFGGMGTNRLINSSIFRWELDLSQAQVRFHYI